MRVEAYTYLGLWFRVVPAENHREGCFLRGVQHRRFSSEESAIASWNTRVAVTDYDFAMAVHDGKLWGKCSECKERQEYYMDAETIQRQQERIAELERERGEWQFKFCNEAGMHASHLFQRDELIRDMWEYLTGGTEYCLSCALRDGCDLDVYGDDCGMRGVFEQRLHRLGIEV